MTITNVLTDHLILKLATALGVTPAKIRAILQDEQGGAAVEYCALFAALVLGVATMLLGTEIAIDAAWQGVESNLADDTPVHLCAGPVRPSPTGGTC